MLHYDDILKSTVGEFGPYQKRCVFLLCLLIIPVAFRVTSQVFMLAHTEHRCHVPEAEDLVEQCKTLNASTDCDGMVWRLLIPKDSNEHACNSDSQWSNCFRYSNNLTNFAALVESRSLNGSYDVIECDHGWIYDKSQYKSTAIHDFDMVCNKEYQAALTISVYMLGGVFGNVLFGQLSDRIGRLKTIMIAQIMGLTSSIAETFTYNYVVFLLAQLFVGAAGNGVYLHTIVLAGELVGPSKRTLVGCLLGTAYSIGYVGLAFIAYFIRDWRMLKIVTNASALIFLSYWWIMPESPRWLLSAGQTKKAIEIIRKTARVNGVTFKEEMFSIQSEKLVIKEDKSKVSPLDLWKFPNMRNKCLILFIFSFSSSLLYYGFTFNTSNIGGNDYINTAVAGAVEVPAIITLGYLLETRLGRRLTSSMLSVLAGCLSLCVIFTPSCGNFLWIRILLCSIGKFLATVVYAFIFIYANELFPTVIRSFGASLASMCALTGAILSPQILLSRVLWEHMPQVIFGVLPILAGLLALLLPETRGRKLPETLEEGEAVAKNTVREFVNVNEKQEASV